MMIVPGRRGAREKEGDRGWREGKRERGEEGKGCGVGWKDEGVKRTGRGEERRENGRGVCVTREERRGEEREWERERGCGVAVVRLTRRVERRTYRR